MIYEYNIQADYFQFVLQDERSTADWSTLWNEKTVAEKIAVADDLVLIGTARNATVPVVVETNNAEPPLDSPDFWDQIVEVEVAFPSGRILLLGNTYLADAPRIEVDPGIYRLRLFYGNLKSVSPDGLKGDDKYRVQIWPVFARNIAQPIFVRKA